MKFLKTWSLWTYFAIHCHVASTAISSVFVSKEGKVGLVKGNATIGGLVPIYQPLKYGNCSKDFGSGFGIQRLEAMIFAVNKINSDPAFQPVNLGLEVRDSCNLESKALEQSLNFVIDKVPDVCQTNGSNSNSQSGKLVGVLGATLSQVTAQVAKLLRLFKIPQISYASTSDALSDVTSYNFLLRTVPSDKYQAEAIADFIANELKWTSVYGIYGVGSYGENGMKAFEAAASKRGICVVDTRAVGSNTSPDAAVKFLKDFKKEKNVPGIVLFCHMLIIEHILQAAVTAKVDKHFRWVGSDGWSLNAAQNNLATNSFVFSLHHHSQRLSEFRNYYRRLKPVKDNTANPWFRDFWLAQCRKLAESKCNTRDSEFVFCDNDSTCFSDDKIPYVIDAVYAIAHALKHLYKDKCNNKQQCLDKLKVDTKYFFENYLKKVTFRGVSGNVSFEVSSAKGVYDISQLINGGFKVVGAWNGGSLKMNSNWVRNDVVSTCGRNCSADGGQIRRLHNGNKCCWTCINCSPTQYVASLYSCKDCQRGETANSNYTGCVPLPIVHWDMGWRVAVSFLASVGCGLTIFVVAVFIRYCSTPVIMAASREISFTLLFAIAFSYSLTFVMASWPEPVSCGVVRFGTGFSMCICYAALLVKTSRIARIFSGQVDPLFITPKWQLILTGFLVLPQALIGLVGLLVNPPRGQFNYDNKSYTLIHCNSNTNDLIVSIAYNLLLIFLCTIYAFRTRKVPENFNEARFIGFVMYTTCAIWFAFLPLFYGASVGYRNVALSLNLILCATTILIGLFGIKVYIVLLRPEKNTRANSKARSFSHLNDSNELQHSTLDRRKGPKKEASTKDAKNQDKDEDEAIGDETLKTRHRNEIRVLLLVLTSLAAISFCQAAGNGKSNGKANGRKTLDGLLAESASLPLLLSCHKKYKYIVIGGITVNGTEVSTAEQNTAVTECETQLSDPHNKGTYPGLTACLIKLGRSGSLENSGAARAIYKCDVAKPSGAGGNVWVIEDETTVYDAKRTGNKMRFVCPGQTQIVQVKNVMKHGDSVSTDDLIVYQEAVPRECYRQTVQSVKQGIKKNVDCVIEYSTARTDDLAMKYQCIETKINTVQENVEYITV
eukprot:gene11929-13164_t